MHNLLSDSFYWLKAIFIGIFVFLLFSGIHYYMMKKRLRILYRAVDQLMDSKVKKIPFSSMGEFEDLARKINDISDDLQRRLADQENEKNRLKTILEAMREGVLVTNDNLKVQIINPALENIFSLEESNPQDRSVLEIIRDDRVDQFLHQVVQDKKILKHEIEISKGLEKKYVIMNVAPFFKGEEIIGTVSIFSDITELRKLENIRKDFMANVSHELKTPLTNILGYAETLQGGALSDPKFSQRFVDKIESNARYLQNLVKDLLNLAAIEHGQWNFKKEEINLLNLLKELKTFYLDELEEKKIILDIEVDENILIKADPQAIRQIMGNLVDNAVKYSYTDSKIKIKCEVRDEEIEVSVSDQGMGMSVEDSQRVFERFFRADKSRTEKGTGLGLAIVKHLVQSHGGRVAVRSELDQGSTFSVIFLK